MIRIQKDEELPVTKETLINKYGVDFEKSVNFFNINKAEMSIIKEWYKSLEPEILALQIPTRTKEIKRLVQDNELYYGAIGGGLSFIFNNTSIGYILTVKEHTTGKELNVTEALDWYFFG